MTCSVRNPSRRRATEIAGTWDFKWPLGTQIRVAFQQPKLGRDSDFENARLEVISLARRWEDALAKELARSSQGTAADFFRSGIRFDFPEELVFDPPGPNGSIVADERRSTFLPKDPRRLQYDVLVSFENLPFDRRRARPISRSDQEPHTASDAVDVERVATPTSELGCYARRCDFGVPTVYLGRFGEKGHKLTLQEYYKCPLIQHVVVHEFGHVLGLAHEHQNPYFVRTPYLEPERIRQSFTKVFQLSANQISDNDVMEQLTDAWPGSPEFSDWDDLRDSRRTLYNMDSIMAYPFHHLFLKPELRPANLPKANETSADIKEVEKWVKQLMTPSDGKHANGDSTLRGLLTHPTRTDVANLVRMYAPGYRRRSSRQSSGQQ